MKTFLLICFILCANTYVITQSILSDPNLKIWLIADSCITDPSNLVSIWPDLSGGNHDFFQNTNSKKPLLTDSEYFQNHQELKFDGVNDQLVNLLVENINTEDLTVFILSSGLPQGNVRSGLFCVNGISNGLTMARNIEVVNILEFGLIYLQDLIRAVNQHLIPILHVFYLTKGRLASTQKYI